MGYIAHEAIIVTGSGTKYLKPALEKARALGLPCSEPVCSPFNGYVSFLIAPDGSKEGWDESLKGEEAREEWIKFVRTTKGFWCDWIHVRYGGDEPHLASVADHNGKGDDDL